VARVIQLTNQERAARGVAAVTANTLLNRAAQKYAEVLATGSCWGHNCPPVPDPGQRITNEGYTWSAWGENIAAGQDTPEEVVADWMASTMGHRETILNPAYREIGVGVATGPGEFGIYWVQVFASPL
jgi:uncharacterized protein YkwD